MRIEPGDGAFVTGAASGIGLAVASALATRGMRVVLADVERDALDRAVAGVRATGGVAHGVRLDVTDAGAFRAAADEAERLVGPVQLLVNNAGVSVKGRVWELDASDWQWVLDVCLWGTINGVGAFVPGMIARGRPAHVVNTGSMMSLGGAPFGAPYQAAKQGIAAISEALAFELGDVAPHVGVTLLCPGYTATNIRDASRNRGHRYEAVPRPPIATPKPVTSVEHAPPAAIAELAIAAVEQGRFYALADWDDWRPAVARRFDAILDRSAPVPVALAPHVMP